MMQSLFMRCLRFRSFEETIDGLQSGGAGSQCTLLQIEQVLGKPSGMGATG
jgi:hypothetical protein